jgi:cytidyltransferase-like protein
MARPKKITPKTRQKQSGKQAVLPAKPATLAAIRTIQNRFGHSKFIESNERLAKIVESHRTQNPDIKILLVLGTYDLIHIGHARYIQRCREMADVVIVIVDPDKAVRLSKGANEDRPVVPEWERLEMLAHLAHTDYIAFQEEGDFDSKTGLWLRKPPFRPNIMVLSRRSPSDKEHEKACAAITDRLVVLESQAETSTTGKVRMLLVNNMGHVEQAIIEKVKTAFDQMRGGGVKHEE